MTRSSRPIAFALHKATENIYRERGFASAGVLNNWAVIVGEKLARHTMPERLGHDGTLHLRIDGPLATELKHQEPQILERIASYFGYRAVTRLRLINGPVEKTEPPTPPSPRTPRAPSPDSAESLAESIRDTNNDEVRSALARLGRAILNQQRKF